LFIREFGNSRSFVQLLVLFEDFSFLTLERLFIFFRLVQILESGSFRHGTKMELLELGLGLVSFQTIHFKILNFRSEKVTFLFRDFNLDQSKGLKQACCIICLI